MSVERLISMAENVLYDRMNSQKADIHSDDTKCSYWYSLNRHKASVIHFLFYGPETQRWKVKFLEKRWLAFEEEMAFLKLWGASKLQKYMLGGGGDSVVGFSLYKRIYSIVSRSRHVVIFTSSVKYCNRCSDCISRNVRSYVTIM